jgi:hypothetical protein
MHLQDVRRYSFHTEGKVKLFGVILTGDKAIRVTDTDIQDLEVRRNVPISLGNLSRVG